jgi:hypothetical protein
MFSAASNTPTPPWGLLRRIARESAMKKITCPLCGSDRLIKLPTQRVTRTGNVLIVYCCASDAHMFLPEIEPKEITAESRGTTAHGGGKRRTR